MLAHVARANLLWRACEPGSKVMVIFNGASAYVSPNACPGKHESHRQVPTWNDEVVHAHGVLTVHDDERFVRQVVALLTRRHEAGEPRPWKMGDSALAFIDEMLGKIVGIEITITSLAGKAKLGQNREARDRLGAADALQAQGHRALPERMRQAGSPPPLPADPWGRGGDANASHVPERSCRSVLDCRVAMVSGDGDAVSDAEVEAEIFTLLGRRQAGATVCPSEVARALTDGGQAWRDLMPRVRQVAQVLVRAGRLRVTRRGAKVDDATRPGGPIRLGLPVGPNED